MIHGIIIGIFLTMAGIYLNFITFMFFDSFGWNLSLRKTYKFIMIPFVVFLWILIKVMYLTIKNGVKHD